MRRTTREPPCAPIRSLASAAAARTRFTRNAYPYAGKIHERKRLDERKRLELERPANAARPPITRS